MPVEARDSEDSLTRSSRTREAPCGMVICLAMHGEPPKDFPEEELAEFFRLHAQVESNRLQDPTLIRRYRDLDTRIRNWPRTAENDPFYAGSQAMAAQLKKTTGYEVIVGFNEFCGPSLDEALKQAVGRKAAKVMVITAMMTPGGRHSEIEIPAAVRQAQKAHPGAAISYLWPFDLSEVAQFLSGQIRRVTQQTNEVKGKQPAGDFTHQSQTQ